MWDHMAQDPEAYDAYIGCYSDELLGVVEASAPRPQSQLSIDSDQRSVLVGWMREVCDTYEVSNDGFSTAVMIMDRYLSAKTVPVGRLQLVAATSLLIAAKYEERYYPAITEFVFLCDGLYTADDFLNAQDEILTAIHFRLTRADVRFAARMMIIGQHTDQTYRSAVDFVSECSLWSHYLQNSDIAKVANVVLDTVEIGTSIPKDYAEKILKSELSDAISVRSSQNR